MKPGKKRKTPAKKKGSQSLAATRDRVRAILDLLRHRYPETIALTFDDPFQLLVATILSAQCTDEQVNKVTPVLFARYPTPAALAVADPEDVRRIVHSTGFFNQKTKSIIGASQAISALPGQAVPRSLDELVKLPGVARKTANVVLYGAYGIMEGIAVDTHVTRLALRLGLTTETDANRIEQDLLRVTPEKDRGAVTLLLIWHGRRVCAAKKPLCGECDLLPLCPHGRATLGMRPKASEVAQASGLRSPKARRKA